MGLFRDSGRKSLAKLVKAKVTGRRIPVRVCLLVTKYCNLTCFFCYAEDILNSKAVQEYSLDNIKNIVDQLYKAECRQIPIVGGEPLIRDDIGEIIDYIHNKGIFVEMTTNGYFVKKRIEALKKVDHLCIFHLNHVVDVWGYLKIPMKTTILGVTYPKKRVKR